MEYDIVQGDIAAQSADALVNAANTSLRMGAGVAGALRRGAGEGIAAEAMATGPIDLGAVAVTDAYDLEADHVIHAAAMPHAGEATADSIRDATRHMLERADELGCESLVLPALGCGIAGFDLAAGAEIIGAELERYEPETLSTVQLIAYSDEEYDVLRAAAGNAEEATLSEERNPDR
ncbi:macro domain-containing protein [Natrinema gari]|uniref:Appr-1-p processing domain-containing protein n=1 Tax=Natrinema gari JCM 14663 TaxID=1230459 RepID=L9YPS2_9EURY|nr:macro domain-containing protein [Natrinema gari]ELY75452.1 Appr-1-p processing domain-containing protein [Natrinema gari JCM 14663]